LDLWVFLITAELRVIISAGILAIPVDASDCALIRYSAGLNGRV
jgi:hypothetical protein